MCLKQGRVLFGEAKRIHGCNSRYDNKYYNTARYNLKGNIFNVSARVLQSVTTVDTLMGVTD
jgi:hypothetical protein